MTMITYKVAETKDEFTQIHKLNYQTFVEEIQQHEVNNDQTLVDPFINKSVYIIAKREDEVVGMISINENRPFSLDKKIDNLDDFLPEGTVPCEVRLLSIKEAYRGSRIFYGLCEHLVSYCLDAGYTVALISGTLQQAKLYRHMGFKPFGPLVGTEKAPYQPMFLTKQNFEKASLIFKRLMERKEKKLYHNFLPGPVEMVKEVQEAWQRPAESHRAQSFQNIMDRVRVQLCRLTKANHVEIAVGTGTMANEMIAAQLTSHPGRGLILANGEFGDRLIKQANRWQLPYESFQKPWNEPFTVEEVDAFLASNPDIRWLWTVHCETSTGYLYPLEQLKEVCRKYNVNLCLDACSSVGVIPVDLSTVYLASTVSGKGLASYPGLAVIFHQHTLSPNESIPAYLDIACYQETNSVPFTHSSNGLFALYTALSHPLPANQELADNISQELASSGLTILSKNDYSPGIITIELPPSVSSMDFGNRLKSHGIHTSYESAYLLERNWFQLALMGKQIESNVWKAVNILREQFEKIHKEKVKN
ncbi:aminotransferase class V-fold PLP-dependent enzyme [Virgibacillus flavescens]|uniref:aminotransferase class V-fold PLP-dependent enzyme n=1 Tax=Virgibacillus flavescens TaxID=1611422 RepID=UPI003D354F3C